jgi:hypothetical protein
VKYWVLFRIGLFKANLPLAHIASAEAGMFENVSQTGFRRIETLTEVLERYARLTVAADQFQSELLLPTKAAVFPFFEVQVRDKDRTRSLPGVGPLPAKQRAENGWESNRGKVPVGKTTGTCCYPSP